MVVLHAMKGDTLNIHAGGQYLEDIGSRQWIYITEYVRALLFLLERGHAGEAYNVAGHELNNGILVNLVMGCLNQNFDVKFVQAPKTHDLHYRISDEKYRALLPNPPDRDTFAEDFKRTVLWLKDHWKEL